VEYLPPQRSEKLVISEYESSASPEGNSVLCRSRTSTHAAMVPADGNYVPLKRFYDFAAASDQAVLVFRRP